jgi:tetratricopeptide (TPR) repeat protein
MSTTHSSPLDFLKTLPIAEAIQLLGNLSDSVYDLDDAAGMALIDDAIPATEALLAEQPVNNLECIHLRYVLANLWDHRHRLKVQTDQEYTWTWNSEEHAEELASLRESVAHPGFSRLEPSDRCSVLTNLGNCLHQIGRPIEAIEFWEQALAVHPAFPMAQGNLGIGLHHYGASLYDPGHKAIFFQFALRFLEQAITKELYDEDRNAFQAQINAINTFLSDSKVICGLKLKDFPTGRSKAERAYRDWCLKNRLFLNPLNDLGPYSIAAKDIIHCPPIIKPLSDEMIPWEHKLINQMKQEFISARFIFYEALQSKSLHFADRNTVIIDTLNFASYSLRTEKIKASLRMAYSLLDKVAWFLDEYFFRRDGKGEKGLVYFQGVWHEKKHRSTELKAAFKNRKNWPLRGLYSLRNDFFPHKNNLYMPTNIMFLNHIRNNIEHNFFVVLMSECVGNSIPEHERRADREYVVTSHELETAALDMLKTARSSIIYLLLAIHTEERKLEDAKSRLVIPMTPVIFEDRWKR